MTHIDCLLPYGVMYSVQSRETRLMNEFMHLYIQLDKHPGGTETLLLLVKFCYGWRVDLMASDFLSLYYVAHSSGISDDIEQGNLIMYCPKPRIF